jgi:hypothetical protein
VASDRQAPDSMEESMRTGFEVKTTKSKLLDTLRDNRARHLKAFEETAIAFGQRYVEEADKMRRYGLQTSMPADIARLPTVMDLPRPMSFVEDYDRIIGMLELSASDEKVDLTEEQYRMFVEDKWSWSEQFIATSSHYGR